MQISPLRQSDELTVRDWARAYLSRYLLQRSEAYGNAMTLAEAEKHIDEHELESALWHDLVHADTNDAEYVAVVRVGTAAVGLMLAEERLEPYLKISVGSVRWIYVADEFRRQGVSVLLLEAADRWISNRGLNAREVMIAADNKAGYHLYQRAGYHDVERMLAAGAPGPERGNK